jgi:peptidoglycan hydrolase-like protein with peptidoglycan-binding domain
MSLRVSRGLVVSALVLAGGVGATGCGSGADGSHPGTDAAATTREAPAQARTTITRWPARTGRDGTANVNVELSAVPAPGSPRPTLSPHVEGTWSTHGTTETFTPTSTLTPCAEYRLKVPAATVAAGAAPLGRARTAHLRVACPTTRAAENALAHLRYLPTRVSGGGTTALPASGSVTRAQAAAQLFRPTGRLVARWDDAPKVVKGQVTPALTGAIMAFQHRRGLTVDGVMGPSTWRSLLAAEADGQRAEGPYTWVTVEKGGAESLTVHRAGASVLTTPANTGAPGAETESGSFPVFEHVAASDMSGTNPDGSHYDDPGVPWVSYFNGGDAVHGFERASYGSRQSAGCVELPIATAKRVYGMLDIGDIVTVAG